MYPGALQQTSFGVIYSCAEMSRDETLTKLINTAHCTCNGSVFVNFHYSTNKN